MGTRSQSVSCRRKEVTGVIPSTFRKSEIREVKTFGPSETYSPKTFGCILVETETRSSDRMFVSRMTQNIQ